MSDWFERTVLDTGRLRLFCFLVALIVGFLFIRFSVRMIRAGVKWWPGNVTPGGLHIHHMVFGLVFMVVGGVGGLAVQADRSAWGVVAASLFGVGTALVLDEFALVVFLRDVYWSPLGRLSVDAVFLVVALTGLIIVGARPLGWDEAVTPGRVDPLVGDWAIAGVVLANLAFVLVALMKGKVWTGVLGVFVPVLAVVGAVRAARPDSHWAHRYYADDSHRMRIARERERRLREPVMRVKAAVEQLLAGRFGRAPNGPNGTSSDSPSDGGKH